MAALVGGWAAGWLLVTALWMARWMREARGCSLEDAVLLLALNAVLWPLVAVAVLLRAALVATLGVRR